MSSSANSSNSLRQIKQFPRGDSLSIDEVDDKHDDEHDDSINKSGVAADDARFGAGGCTTFIDPWSVPDDGAVLDGACMPDESIDFPDVLKYSSPIFSNSSSHRFPSTIVMSLGMWSTLTRA